MDAVMEVVDAIHRAEAHDRRSRRIVLLITLDIGNALRKMDRYARHIRKLIPCIKLSLADIENSLKDRTLLYETIEGQKRKEITSGVAQGSILRPEVWNAFYDSPLRLDMPEESRLVSYADDVAALVAGRTVEQAKSRQLIDATGKWMNRRERGSYADIPKRVKTDPELRNLEDNASYIRQSQKGDLRKLI